jgi:hypothetical protein
MEAPKEKPKKEENFGRVSLDIRDSKAGHFD